MPTIAKLMRSKKTFANKIKTSQSRATANAVKFPEEKVDFDVQKCVIDFLRNQDELREAKTQIAQKTISTLVKIPDNVSTIEHGTEVPLFKAILIRDDLKAYKALLDSLIAMPTVQTKWGYRDEDDNKVLVKERLFSFDEYVKESEKIQEDIDTIDSLIQYTDNTV